MTRNTREKDLALFVDLARERGQNIETTDRSTTACSIPAFMISEIRRGFEIGFLVVLPFLVIDLIVATITMAMGMMMLPPTSISLPFKILFFVLIDGWNLLVGSLVRSFTENARCPRNDRIDLSSNKEAGDPCDRRLLCLHVNGVCGQKPALRRERRGALGKRRHVQVIGCQTLLGALGPCFHRPSQDGRQNRSASKSGAISACLRSSAL
jgi:hypothetical protein